MLGRQLNEDDSAGVIPINSMYEPGAGDEVHAATTDGATLPGEYETAGTSDAKKASPKKSPPSK